MKRQDEPKWDITTYDMNRFYTHISAPLDDSHKKNKTFKKITKIKKTTG